MIEPEMCFIELRRPYEYHRRLHQILCPCLFTHTQRRNRIFDKHYQNGLKEQLKALVAAPFKRMTYTEVVECLERDCGVAQLCE